ncbi:MAG TPA: SCP2 sterol-binding domain-containing protein [Nevskiaceae bacterium]
MHAPAPLCATLEVLLNRVLRAEPAAVRRCGALAGRTVALEPRDLGWRFLIEMQSGGVRVYSDDSAPADATLRGPSLRLIAAALHLEASVPPGELEVSGDALLLQEFSKALAVAGFDSEEWLAGVTGDVVAHRATQAVRGLLGWLESSSRDLAFSGAEYLREETGDLARAGDVEAWLQGVERLRERLDRCDARLRLLEPRR